MKIASMAIFFGFLILPALIYAFYILFKIVTEGIDSLHRPSPRLERLRARPRLFYALLSTYCLLFFGSLSWMIYELTQGLVQMRALIFLLAAYLIFFSLYLGWKFKHDQNLREKFPPPPEGSSKAAYLEWENRIFDESSKPATRFLERYGFRIGIGFIALMVSLAILTLIELLLSYNR